MLTLLVIIAAVFALMVAVKDSVKKAKKTGPVDTAPDATPSGNTAGTPSRLRLVRVPKMPNMVFNMIGTAVVLAVLAGVLYSIHWIFPDFVRNYEVQGGPTWTLFFGLAIAAIIYTIGNGNKESSYVSGFLAIVTLGFAMVYVIIAGMYGADTTRSEVRVVQTDAERHLSASRRQAEALARTPGGPQCANVVHRDHLFGNKPDESSIVNPGGRCAFQQFFPPPGTCFYMQAYGSKEPKGPFGTCSEAIPFVENAPLDTEKVWSAGQSFVAYFTLMPRGSTPTRLYP